MNFPGTKTVPKLQEKLQTGKNVKLKKSFYDNLHLVCKIVKKTYWPKRSNVKETFRKSKLKKLFVIFEKLR